jgi:aconitate hydratase
MIVPPPKKSEGFDVVRGPNIKPLPEFDPLPDILRGRILLKVEDNITTDHIMPAGAKVLPLRSNIPAISEHVFVRVDPEFPKRAKDWQGGFIIGGENYGQGSSREHAALAPKYLGVKAVIVKSFARIHLSNLINFGIVPLTFKDPTDYLFISQGDEIEIPNIRTIIQKGGVLKALNKTSGKTFVLNYDLTPRLKEIIFAGGALNYSKIES